MRLAHTYQSMWRDHNTLATMIAKYRLIVLCVTILPDVAVTSEIFLSNLVNRSEESHQSGLYTIKIGSTTPNLQNFVDQGFVS